jgi:replicative DNA helicase
LADISEIKEELILSQLVKNSLFRDKVFSYLKPNFFDEENNESFFKNLEILVLDDRVKVLDKSTLSLRITDQEKINNVLAENDFPAENLSLLIKETEKWAQNQFLKNALIKSVDLFKEKKDKHIIGNLIKEAIAYTFDKNLGLSYRNDIERRFDFYNKVEQKLATGYDMMDYHTFGGLQRKTLTIAAASSGLGKTLLGTNLAASLIRRGHNGIYLTLELAEELIARRMDSINTGIPYYEIPRSKKQVEEFIKKNVSGECQIREYAPSKACAMNILSFVQELKMRYGWDPAWLAVDYVQLMKPNNPTANMNSHDKYKAIAEELREIACELDMPVISFSQVQRAGYDNSNLGLSHISDSIGIVNTADLVIGMTQTAEEASEGYQTWKIIKNRLGRRGVELRVKQDSETLRFNQVLTPEETRLLEDFRERRKDVVNLDRQADIEKDKEQPEAVEQGFGDYIKGLDKTPDIYSEFS